MTEQNNNFKELEIEALMKQNALLEEQNKKLDKQNEVLEHTLSQFRLLNDILRARLR